MKDLLLHDGDTAAALNDLCWILARGQEDCSDNVGGMGVVSANAACHC